MAARPDLLTAFSAVFLGSEICRWSSTADRPLDSKALKVEPGLSSPARALPPPRSGHALFAWTKEQEHRHQVGLLRYLNGWAKFRDFPGRMVDWNADQVTQAHGEAIRKLQLIQAGRAKVDRGSPDEMSDRFLNGSRPRVDL